MLGSTYCSSSLIRDGVGSLAALLMVPAACACAPCVSCMIRSLVLVIPEEISALPKDP